MPTAPFAVMMEGDVWGKFLKLKKKFCTCTPVGGCVHAFVCVVYGTVISS